jgi:repressor LexA
MRMPRPPHKQLRILAALREAQTRNGALPELATLARDFDIRYPTLREHLDALARKGYLRLDSRGPGRSPKLTLLHSARGIPLYGDIAAGLPIGAEPEIEGLLALPPSPERFALRVRGDSMADRIEAGDVVLLERRSPQRQGEICAVRVGDDDSTLKYLAWSGPARHPSRYLLRPHNAAYPTLEVAPAELRIDGVYRGLLRGEIVHDLWLEKGSEAQ